MKQTLIRQIQQEMAGVLNNAQRQKLKEVLEHCFFYVDVVSLENQSLSQTKNNQTLKEEFLSYSPTENSITRFSLLLVNFPDTWPEDAPSFPRWTR